MNVANTDKTQQEGRSPILDRALVYALMTYIIVTIALYVETGAFYSPLGWPLLSALLIITVAGAIVWKTDEEQKRSNHE